MNIKLKLKLKPNNLGFETELELDPSKSTDPVLLALEEFTHAYHNQKGMDYNNTDDPLFNEDQVEVTEIIVNDKTLELNTLLKNLEDACYVVALIEEHKEAAVIFLEDCTSGPADFEVTRDFENSYFGEFSSEEELAKEWIEQHDRIDFINASRIKHLLDWGKVLKNAKESLYIAKSHNGKFYAFSRCR